MKLSFRRIFILLLMTSLFFSIFSFSLSESKGSIELLIKDYGPYKKDLEGITNESDGAIAVKKYVDFLVKLSFGLGSVLAVILLIWGGFNYITSEGISSTEEGKSKIRRALGGLIILFISFSIFNTINPKLLEVNIGSNSLNLEVKSLNPDFKGIQGLVENVAKDGFNLEKRECYTDRDECTKARNGYAKTNNDKDVTNCVPYYKGMTIHYTKFPTASSGFCFFFRKKGEWFSNDIDKLESKADAFCSNKKGIGHVAIRMEVEMGVDECKEKIENNQPFIDRGWIYNSEYKVDEELKDFDGQCSLVKKTIDENGKTKEVVSVFRTCLPVISGI